LSRAWKRYRRALLALLHHELHVPRELLRFPYVRVQEITASDGGHAHYHFWCFLPYIPQAVHAFLWGRALSTAYRARLPAVDVRQLIDRQSDLRSRELVRAVLVSRRGADGRSLQQISLPIVHVRHGRDAEHELIKYLVKDATRDACGRLSYVPAEVYAALYAALEGRRTIQTSASFWVREASPREERCAECGRVHSGNDRPVCQIVEAVRPAADEGR